MHKVISRISSCIGPDLAPTRNLEVPAQGSNKQCVTAIEWGLFSRFWPRCRSYMRPPPARRPGIIEQNFASLPHRGPGGKSRRIGRVLRAGLFQRLDEPGQAAGGFFGHAQRPQRLRNPPPGPEADRLFRHIRQDGGKLPQIAGCAKTVRDRRSLHRRHRRARRNRSQFRGRLGGHGRDRRARGRGADGRRRRRRALCLHQPGAADQDHRKN